MKTMQNNKLRNESKTEYKLHRMRFYAQIAEKAGYTIAGVAAAFAISGVSGIISFGLTMLLFANLQSHLIKIWGFSLGCQSLRVSLVLRASSFAFLALGALNDSIGFMLLGAGLSGFFVGLFWPTFYTMKRANIGEWFAMEKSTGVALTVLSGILVLYVSIYWILLLSIVATILSFSMTFSIEQEHYCQSSEQTKPCPTLSSARRVAFLDGSIGESLRMIRRIVLLTGTVSFFNFEGILSFALVLGISEALGAILSKSNLFTPMHFLALAFIGCLMCISGVENWLYGLILLGMSLSALFPDLQIELKESIRVSDSTDLNFRERNRIEGRVVGAFLAGSVYLLQLPTEIVFFWIIFSLLGLLMYSRTLHVKTNSFKRLSTLPSLLWN